MYSKRNPTNNVLNNFTEIGIYKQGTCILTVGFCYIGGLLSLFIFFIKFMYIAIAPYLSIKYVI